MISSDASFTGEIKVSTPNDSMSAVLTGPVNSRLLILAIVRFAPNFLPRIDINRFVSSDEVTAINKSQASILTSLRIRIDLASPLIVKISRLDCISFNLS